MEVLGGSSRGARRMQESRSRFEAERGRHEFEAVTSDRRTQRSLLGALVVGVTCLTTWVSAAEAALGQARPTTVEALAGVAAVLTAASAVLVAQVVRSFRAVLRGTVAGAEVG